MKPSINSPYKKFHDKDGYRRRPIEREFIAGENFTDQVAVYLNSSGEVVKFNSTDLILNRRCFGITSGQSAKAGYPVNVVMLGELWIHSKTLVPGQEYYAIDDGDFALTFPIPGLAVKLGVAMTEKVILVDVDHQEPQGDPLNVTAQDLNITGAIDGVNKDFTTSAQFIAGSFRLYYNGQRLHLTDDYLVTGSDTFTMEWAPIAPGKLLADYIPI